MIRPARVEKRNRPPKSCEPCRARKLKCDRGLPCDTCIRRVKDCHYASNADRNDKRGGKNESVNERLKTLEDLISSMSQKFVPKDPMASLTLVDDSHSIEDEMTELEAGSGPQRLTSEGTGTLSGSQVTHADSSHWSSMLENIRAIRDELSPSNSQLQPSSVISSTPETEPSPAGNHHGQVDLELGSTTPLDLQQILQGLPSRQVCDNLVSHYFRSRHIISPILHPAKFQQEYESFWESPESTSTVWIGLLFSVLSLAANICEFTGIGRGSQNLIPPARDLSKKTQECLILGKYVQADAYGVEALLVHLGSCYMRVKDSDINLWFLMGTMVRLAISKGYHRDPSKLSGYRISQFEGEMRRRVWVTLFQIDALLSFQMGLPSTIPTEYCDTEMPRNLKYSDLDPEMTELPPSRPLHDSTSILYIIVKASVMSMFKTVVGHTRSLMPPPYDATVALDGQIRQVYDNLPRNFKYKPLRQSVVDEPGTIMHRVTIEMLHLKSIIVLHRQYITHRQDTRYDFSRHACLEAAFQILDRQVELHEATRPGGQLHDVGRLIPTLTKNDFILAGMVICLDLTISMKQNASIGGAQGSDDEQFERSAKAIQQAYQIWESASTTSSEARIVAHALSSTMERIATGQNIGDNLSSEVLQASNSRADQDSAFPETLNATDVMEYVDWTLLDYPFHDPLGEDLDLDLWLTDSAGPSGSFDLI
ncbi:hypothetical protein NM208_g5087 [Fusarium decemcellulare]|uniref:Uncharacterized protein n=1 Tax=Fusarium decemcellulare TaxID=57161 RepID=A0ACC1SIE8_9HYPO|nr:hypothetical protein NM208_g5087 [Fusarium decemcellulare]